MPTRFYFPSTGTADVTPTPDSDWEGTTGLDARRLPTTKTNTALANGDALTRGSSASGVRDFADRIYVSDPIGAGAISGTFSMVIRGQESNAAANAWLQVFIRVVSNDGQTVRGTLYNGSTATAPSTTTSAENGEWTTTQSTRIKNAITLSSVTAQNGDRIVVGIGHRSTGTSTTYTHTLRYGDPSATADFALTAALTTDLCPWIQLSQTLAAYVPPPPTVDAGADRNAVINKAYSLAATEANFGTVTSRSWSIISAPAGASTGQIGTTNPATWTPSVLGAYTIRYTVNGTVSDDVVVTVIEPPPYVEPVIKSITTAAGASGSNSIAFPRPADLAVGDHMLVWHTNDADLSFSPWGHTPPSAEWTSLARVSVTVASDNHPNADVWSKTADDADVAASTFTFTDTFASGASSSDSTMTMIVLEAGTFDEADPVTIGATRKQIRVATTLQTMDSHPTLHEFDLLFAFFASDINNTPSAAPFQAYPDPGPAGMTFGSSVRGPGNYSLQGTYYESVAADGASGTRTVTPSNAGTVNGWCSVSLTVNRGISLSQDISKTGTDAATLAESAAVVRTSSAADTATLTEGAPTLAQTNAVAGSDAATLGEAATLVVTGLAGSDSSTLTEGAPSLAQTNAVAGTDAATQTDLAAVSADIGHSDTATQTDAAAVLGTYAGTDSATLSEQAAALAAYSGADAATLAEQGALAAALAGTVDTAALAEQAATSATLAAADSATLGEQTALEAGAQLAGADSATLGELAAVVALLAGADTSSTTDAAGPRTLEVDDDGTLLEAVDTAATLAGADVAGTLAELDAVISAGISGSDSATLAAEQTSLAAGAQVTGSDSATTTDLAGPPAAALTGGDAGTTADGANLAALLAGTDAATGAPETADLLASHAASDVATSTESALLDTAVIAPTDASAATDAANLAATIGRTDLAELGELATVDVTLAATDASTLTDSAALAIGTELRTGTDAATLAEGATVAASVQASDTAALTGEQTSVAGSNAPTGSDAATQTETGATVVAAATVADVASLPSEAGAVAVSLAVADTAALSESANVTIGIESRTAADAAVEVDTATLAATLTGADTAAQADLAELAASTAGTDAATLGEAADVEIALERVNVADVATMAEAASLRVLLSVTDQIAQTVDTVRAWVWMAGTDVGAMVDSAQVVNTTTTAVWPIRAGEPDRRSAVAGGEPYVRDTITTGATRVGAPIRAGTPTRRPWNREE